MYAAFWLVALLLKDQGSCFVSGDHFLDDSSSSFMLREYVQNRALISKMASKSEFYNLNNVLVEERVTDYETDSSGYVYKDSELMSKLSSSGKALALTYKMYPEYESFERTNVPSKVYATVLRKRRRGIRNENDQKVDEKRQENGASSSDTVSDDTSDPSKSNRYKKPLALADRLSPESEAVADRMHLESKVVGSAEGSTKTGPSDQRRSIQNENEFIKEERQDSVANPGFGSWGG